MEHKKKRWLPWPSKKGVDREFKQLLDKVEQSPDDPRLHQRLAEFYLEKGQEKKAVEQFTKAAECHCEAGFYLRAIALYRRIIRMQGESTTILLKLGELYLINGLLGDALVQFEKVIQQYRKKGKVAEIPGLLKRMVDADPENLEIRAKHIELLRSEGFAGEALDELLSLYEDEEEANISRYFKDLENQIREVYTELRDSYTKTGEQEKLGALDERLGPILRSAEPSPPDHDADTEVVEEIEDFLEAVDSSDEATSLSETDIRQQLHEADLYLEQGLFDEAESLFQGVLDIDPEHAEALQGLKKAHGVREEIMGATDKAGEHLTQARQSSEAGRKAAPEPTAKAPDDARVRFELGLAYRELELVDECIKELLVAVKDPSLAFPSHRELGVCYLQKGNVEEAIKHFQAAIHCPGIPDDQLLEVRYELAQILEQHGERQQALDLYQEIEEKNEAYRDVRDRVKTLNQ